MLHDLPFPNCCRFIYKLKYAITTCMGRVFRERFVSFITFEVYYICTCSKFLTCFVGKSSC